ncbi:MAG: tail fiber domain-containing protein [Methylococcales bacterium]|nr:MAG: tail fiber domain-containing protein [Methylococcales bacterium]
MNGGYNGYGTHNFFGGNGGTNGNGFDFEDQGTFVRIAHRNMRFWDWNGAGDFMYLQSGTVGVGGQNTGYKFFVNGNDFAVGRRYTNDWFSNYGTAGLYNDTYGNSFYKNDAYYGNWKIDSGNAINGWNGIRFTNQELTLMMGTTAGDRSCGIYMNGVGWDIYSDASRNWYCVGNITTNWSDRRLKKDFVQVEDYDEILNGMTAYRFRWSDVGEKITSGAVKENEESLSLIAQDVQNVLPGAVRVNKAGASLNTENTFDYLTIDFDKITPILVEALKHTRQELREARERLDALEKLIAKQ